MTHDLASALAWMGTGTKAAMKVVTTLEPDTFDRPSRLAGWDRRTVIAHLARNADALVRLLRWARTGVETPMYSSPQERIEEIAYSAQHSPAVLVEDLRAATARLNLAVSQLPENRWSYPVRSALGRSITAAEVPWLRAREVWLHAVDIGTTATHKDFPPPFAVALIDDVLATRRSRGELTDVTVATDGHEWAVNGAEADRINATPSVLAGWLTNRIADDAAVVAGFPPLGPWI